MFCPNCNIEQTDENKFCTNCGNEYRAGGKQNTETNADFLKLIRMEKYKDALETIDEIEAGN